MTCVLLLTVLLQDPRWSTIENGKIRVGVDAGRGGSIVLLADVETGWSGVITGRRFDPIPSGSPGDRLMLRFVSATPP